MAFLVVAYPRLSPDDFGMIQQYRRLHDLRYFDVVAPHFTIVFAIADVSPEDFIAETRRRTLGTKRFGFVIRVATVNRDACGTYYHDFLVPDTGYSNFVKLHDALYSGTLANHLRLDIDYIPHIGIGNSEDVALVKQRVDAWNARGIVIEGSIDALDIIEYTDGRVKTLDTITLA